MAVLDYLENLNDVRLKPRLLRSLIRNSLPNDERPFPSPSQLSSVLSYVKTHGLLSESLHRPPADARQLESWKSAMDAWVDHSLSLASSKMPDKCWAGICLLGVTCEECGTDRFLASYPVWFQNLLPKIQPPSDSHFVQVASCASLSDLFTRLAGFSNAKKDAVSIAGKLIQPVLQLLSEGGTDAVWAGAIDLLCTLTTFFPSSIHRHYDRVEAIIVSKIMSGKCSVNVSKKLALCLSLLPKVRGDEDSWTLMMQKILISIHIHLNEPFQGLEEDTKSSEIMRLLVPPGKDPPPPLGQSLSIEASGQATKRLQDLVVPRVSTLMQCCCMMLTNSYPVQVTIPVRPLLALVGRVLMVDGSLCESLAPFTTVMHQELLCSELPALHLNSLDLLIAIIKGVRSQLLPHAANVVRLLTEYFRRATLPHIRIKIYKIVQILLISMGVGMALYLAQEVINNAFADLSFNSHASGSVSSNTQSAKVTSAVLQNGSHRKRKHVSGSSGEHQNGVNVEVEAVNRKRIVPLSVQIAALGAVEALVTVGGSLRSECWRSTVDLFLITVATNACDAGWANEEKSVILTEESTSTRADLQLAALKALLASLLSPAHVRPPYLSQGLELFHRGKQETGTKLAAFCAHALLALEVLIHPRALPLVDSPVAKSSTFDGGFNHRLSESIFPGSQKPNAPPFSRGNLVNDLDLDDNDDLYDSWLGDGDETGVDVSNPDKQMEDVEQPVGVASEDPLPENLIVNVSAGEHVAVEGSQEPIGGFDVEMACGSRDESMDKLTKLEQPAEACTSVLAGNDIASPSEGAVTAGSAIFRNDNTPDKGFAVSTNDLDLSKDDIVSTGGLAVSSKEKEMTSYDSDSPSLNSLPDIVDADPDSD